MLLTASNSSPSTSHDREYSCPSFGCPVAAMAADNSGAVRMCVCVLTRHAEFRWATYRTSGGCRIKGGDMTLQCYVVMIIVADMHDRLYIVPNQFENKCVGYMGCVCACVCACVW